MCLGLSVSNPGKSQENQDRLATLLGAVPKGAVSSPRPSSDAQKWAVSASDSLQSWKPCSPCWRFKADSGVSVFYCCFKAWCKNGWHILGDPWTTEFPSADGEKVINSSNTFLQWEKSDSLFIEPSFTKCKIFIYNFQYVVLHLLQMGIRSYLLVHPWCTVSEKMGALSSELRARQLTESRSVQGWETDRVQRTNYQAGLGFLKRQHLRREDNGTKP